MIKPNRKLRDVPEPNLVQVHCIERTGDKTSVTVDAWIAGRKYSVTDSAKRVPYDLENPILGVQLAVGKALTVLAQKIMRDANTHLNINNRESEKLLRRVAKESKRFKEPTTAPCGCS